MSNNTTYSSPDNFSTPCNSVDGERMCDSCIYAIFASSIIIIILSPVAVVGNALILAAIWKKMFQRTSLHVLLSGLAITDLCTGLIAQPLMAAPSLLYLTSPRLLTGRIFETVWTVGIVSGEYFGTTSLLIITILSIERWLHMTRRSLVACRRGFFTFILSFLIPIPFVVFSVLDFTKDRNGREGNTTIAVFMSFCYLTTSVAYFKVFRIIRQHQIQVQGNQSSQNFGQPAINLAKYKKSVVLILYILALFSLCFLPMIVSLAVLAHLGITLETWAAYSVSLVLLFLSSSLNPGLYVWRMNDIRNGVKQLFCTNG